MYFLYDAWRVSQNHNPPVALREDTEDSSQPHRGNLIPNFRNMSMGKRKQKRSDEIDFEKQMAEQAIGNREENSLGRNGDGLKTRRNSQRDLA